jgi:hypothetical protein
MAVSDYAILAFDHKGNPSKGICKNTLGDYIELYKKNVFVHSPRHCKKRGKHSCDYSDDIIAHIKSGDASVAGFDIKTKHVRTQHAVFVFATHYTRYNSSNKSYQIRFFAGLACNGYEDEIKKVLIEMGIWEKEKSKRNYSKWGISAHFDSDKTLRVISKFGRKLEEWVYWEDDINGPYEYNYVGVTKELRDEFFSWVKKQRKDLYDHEQVKFDKWYDKCIQSEALSYNQGDAFFAGHLGGDIPVSKVGETPETPVAIQIINNMKV